MIHSSIGEAALCMMRNLLTKDTISIESKQLFAIDFIDSIKERFHTGMQKEIVLNMLSECAIYTTKTMNPDETDAYVSTMYDILYEHAAKNPDGRISQGDIYNLQFNITFTEAMAALKSNVNKQNDKGSVNL